MAASTASTCLRRDGEGVHSQKRDQASARERGCDMAGTLARRSTMEKLVIEGGVPLSGTIVPAGNKNAALPLLAASLLTDEPVVIGNVPRIRDTEAMLALLADLGVRVDWLEDNTVSLQADGIQDTEVDPALAERIRASFLVAGPLLARFGSALMPPPGGDVIGPRPPRLGRAVVPPRGGDVTARRRLAPHLDAFRALGAEVPHDRHIRLSAPN